MCFTLKRCAIEDSGAISRYFNDVERTAPTRCCTSILPLSSQADRIHRKAWVRDCVVEIVHVGLDFVQRWVIESTRRAALLSVFVAVFFATHRFATIDFVFMHLDLAEQVAFLCIPKIDDDILVRP